ncbi:MAG: WxL domain-containing protein [Clostridioides sp.]|jgi:Tfp pilus assembly protein PilW|nr:WxL domain-containing protein [Clostridioides sp.]
MIIQFGFSSGYTTIFAADQKTKRDVPSAQGDTTDATGNVPDASDYDVAEIDKDKIGKEQSKKDENKREKDISGNEGTPKIVEKDNEDTDEIPESNIKQASGEPLLPGEEEVKDWNEFKSAYEDPSVTKIYLTADITSPKLTIKMNLRDRNLTIDGRYHKLTILEVGAGDDHASLPTGDNNTDPNPEFKIENMTIAQTVYVAGEERRNRAFINSSAEGAKKLWTYYAKNIKTEKINDPQNPPISRLIDAEKSRLVIEGEVEVYTASEAAVIGSVTVKNGAKFTSKIVKNGDANIYMLNDVRADNKDKRDFTIEEGATVSLEPADGKGRYPPIFNNFSTITVGKNAKLSCLAAGNAMRFEAGYGSDLEVEEGATLFLKSYGNGSNVIFMSANSSSITTEKGSKIYIYSASKEAVIRMGSDNGTSNKNTITINNPAAFDIVSTKGGDVFSNISRTDSFEVNGVSLFAWNKNADIQKNPTKCFDYANNVTVQVNTTVKSDNPDVTANLKPNNRSRISGGDFTPEIVYGKVPDSCEHNNKLTDADKTIRARVRLGKFPKVDADENISLATDVQDVWATKDFFSRDAKIENSIDSQGVNLNTDENGYLKYTANNFYPSGTHFKATIDRSYISGKSDVVAETDVIDITPPNPSVLVTTPIKYSTRVIDGTADEIGATVKVKYDGAFIQKNGQDVQTTVGADGKWKLELPNIELEAGKSVAIHMIDTSGNINPDVDTVVHDATFKKATAIKVSGVLELSNIPDEISFGTMELTPGSSLEKWGSYTGTLAVVDTRETKKEWQLSAKMSKELTDDYNSSRVMPGVISYYSGGVKNTLTAVGDTIIKQNMNTNSREYVVSSQWNNTNTGLKLEVPASMIRAGQYSGEIKWSLQDVPINP